jgi:hypothetical protein
MPKRLGAIFVLVSCARCIYGQDARTLADHFVWERDFPRMDVSSSGATVADLQGNLWAVGTFLAGPSRLLSVTPDGETRLNTELPPEIDTDFPSRISSE